MGTRAAVKSPVLNIPDAAKYLKITERTLYRLMAASEITYVCVSSGRRVFRIVDLDAYLESKAVSARRPA